jgi:5-oxoprolinase (ATP-hydrolysing)
MRFLGLVDAQTDLQVERYEPDCGRLTLDGALEPKLAEGTGFELVSDEPAPVLVARLLTGTGRASPLPPMRLRLATTLGTNALLQRRGVPTALFITAGFGDLLRIGDQQRPELFALRVERAEPLYEEVVEVPERLDAEGGVLESLNLKAIEVDARSLVRRGVDVAAVSLLHAYRNPEHELRLADALRQWGFRHVSCSADLAPRIKMLPRTETALINAYLAPIVGGYLDRVVDSLTGESRLLVMTSAGGLSAPAGFRPKDSLLSGPAGGVVGAASAGRRAGFKHVIGFDMGGTSTDVARHSGDYDYRFEHRVGDAHLVAPALAIESVAAGGGSICWLDGERLRVGPRSAGASPGPACYGAGGPLTVTDVNLLLGRLVEDRFEIPIRVDAARERFDELLASLRDAGADVDDRAAVLEGLVSIADETMAEAIRTISIRCGYDPAEHALVAFGGAGGQHACSVADRLGLKTIVVPPDAALLSALGLGEAVVERFVERQVLEPLQSAEQSLGGLFDSLGAEAVDSVARAGAGDEIRVRRRMLRLRFGGQESTLEVEWAPETDVAGEFRRAYQALFGHRPEARPIELESVAVAASSTAPASVPPAAGGSRRAATPARKRRIRLGGCWSEIPCYDRERLTPGSTLDGPSLVLERHSTTLLDRGWSAVVGDDGSLVLGRAAQPVAPASGDEPEAIRLELFTQRFEHLVREMGVRLERTAISTNVKERLDFSCALLNAEGELVVNAPHIPVHLGALGLCVRRLIESIPMNSGDVIVTNHPSYGGSHLPDVTVVTPVFDSVEPERRLGFLASRAHHAEIGGTRPGSMPPDSRSLAEEGVVIPPTYLVRGGEPRWDRCRELLEQAPYPTRNVEDNLADLRAAVAANHAGARALRSLAETHGGSTLQRYMERLAGLAEGRIREALRKMPDGSYRARERLDDGTALQVCIELQGDEAEIDFDGTADVHLGNLNATPAIVQSAVIYVLRLLLREPLPLNEGLLRAVSVRIPPGLLNPEFPDDPSRAPAVVGGNVETSQRLVDTMIKALRLAACSQGTMNNVIFGNDRYGYYETVGGGCGAGDGFAGASGVHSHMTNTRITDPEILESRYPVRLERFALRGDSGGSGRFQGGEGLVREIAFLEPARLSILSQHRVERPFGMGGGGAGEPGRQRIRRVDGSVEELGAIDGRDVAVGDRLLLETPGGGGYGGNREES